ncbi:hypothetical protein ACXKV6_004620, partial [Salmonella enterica subsp. enterica]
LASGLLKTGVVGGWWSLRGKKKSPARLERTVPWQGLTINLSGISFFYIPAEPLSGTSLEIIEPLCFSKHYLSP